MQKYEIFSEKAIISRKMTTIAYAWQEIIHHGEGPYSALMEKFRHHPTNRAPRFHRVRKERDAR